MRRLPGETVLSNDYAFRSAAQKAAPRAATSNRESHLCHAARAYPARTINRSLARNVDLAATGRACQKPIVASLRLSVHSSPNHSRRLSREQDRKTNCDPALVLSPRTRLHPSAVPTSPRAGRHSRVKSLFLIRRWTLGVGRWTFSLS